MADRGARPVTLIVIDGWGIAPPGPGNGIALARTPVMDRLAATYPYATVEASGEWVGLPPGQIGNSEVGHLNIGAGYTVLQDLPRIDDAIASGTFAQNPAILGAIKHARAGHRLHVMGLYSDGGVHSHAAHCRAILDLARQHGVADVLVHLFLDGRDVPPRQALTDVKALEQYLATNGGAQIATVTGRYYAMDRDSRWDRVALAYAALSRGEAARAVTASEAVAASYAAGAGDEFVKPTVIEGVDGRIRSADAVIFYNFRADRARQITAALVDPDFAGFERDSRPEGLHFVAFSEYDAALNVTAIAFPPILVEQPLARVVADAGLRQLHVAETEKYAHVTYFLNGGREAAFEGEERALIPSPRVATYDLQPSMAADAIAERAISGLGQGFDLIALNFANPDMVGHTGVLPATIEAVEVVDAAIGRVVDATLGAGGVAIVTADHGNAEEMIDASGQPKTAHTTNPVPLVVAGIDGVGSLASGGRLCDVALTTLDVLGLTAPAAMTGRSLLVRR